MEEQLKYYEILERRHEDAREQLFNLKQALDSHNEFLKLIDQHINDNKSMQQKCAGDERKRSVLSDSYDKLMIKYEKFRGRRVKIESDYNLMIDYKKEIERDMASMQAQIEDSRRFREYRISVDRLDKLDLNNADSNFSLVMTSIPPVSSTQGASATNFQQPLSIPLTTSDAASSVVTDTQQQPAATYDYDVETVNFLNEDNWFLDKSCDREFAEKLLSHFVSGTFLVRRSKKKQNSYALSVVVNNKVQHCLIDELDEGFCFHPPGPQHQMYPTLCDLVIDYRHKSLLLHHPQLNTSLIYPVMSEIKKFKR